MRLFRFGDRSFELGARTYVMGILNVTPDSFSDGGGVDTVEDALRRVETMLEEGADLIDIGGESTRPGFAEVSEDEELKRVLPVITACQSRFPEAVLSIDTSKACVARAALEAGALIVNDIWGFQHDEDMASVVAGHDAACVLMRNGRKSVEGDREDSSIGERVIEFWRRSVEMAEARGISSDRILLDPGIGFGTSREEDLEMLRVIPELRNYGYGLLVGASRKRVTGEPLNLPLDQRLETTLATTVAAIAGGADFVRVHDVKENVRAARMADLIYRGHE